MTTTLMTAAGLLGYSADRLAAVGPRVLDLRTRWTGEAARLFEHRLGEVAAQVDGAAVATAEAADLARAAGVLAERLHGAFTGVA